MAKVEKTEIFPHNIEDIYKVIVDYKSYPEFLGEVQSIDVHEQDEQGARVTYHINLIKNFSYTLKLTHNQPQEISWSFESGDLFKSNEGGWKLKKIDDHSTEVTYWLDLNFKMLVPKPITSKLAKTSLPSMLKSMSARVGEVVEK